MAYFLGFLYIAAHIVIYFSLLLLPYYIAYCIIEPHSFLGVIGVIILGSIIVPLTIGFAFLVFGSFFAAFEKFKEKIGQESQVNHSLYSNESSPLDVTPKSEKKSSKETIFFTILGLSAIAIILFLIVNNGLNKNLEILNGYNESYSENYSEDNDADLDNTLNDYIDTNVMDENEQDSYVVNSIVDNDDLMSYAVDELINTLDSDGITGVVRDVHDCYININIDKLYCLYLDRSARTLDEAISKKIGIERNEYLDNDKVLVRNQKYYYIPTNTSHMAYNHQYMIEAKIINLINAKMERKYRNYKSENIESGNKPVVDNTSVEISQELNRNDTSESIQSEEIYTNVISDLDESSGSEVDYD